MMPRRFLCLCLLSWICCEPSDEGLKTVKKEGPWGKVNFQEHDSTISLRWTEIGRYKSADFEATSMQNNSIWHCHLPEQYTPHSFAVWQSNDTPSYVSRSARGLNGIICCKPFAPKLSICLLMFPSEKFLLSASFAWTSLGSWAPFPFPKSVRHPSKKLAS